MEAIRPAKARVIEVAIIADEVLVTFSDGRITLLDADYLHGRSTEAPVTWKCKFENVIMPPSMSNVPLSVAGVDSLSD